MDNHFLQSSKNLLARWKQLRSSLTSDMSDQDQAQSVSLWWSLAPLGKPYLDYLNPKKWPDAWTLIDSKDFDQATISLGMFYTLLMSSDGRWTQDNLCMAFMRSVQMHHENLCCILRGQLVIGWRHAVVDNLDQMNDITVLHRYTYDAAVRSMAEVKITDLTI